MVDIIDKSRRAFLRQAIFGPSLLGLRSLASGLPAAWLLRPQLVLAAARRAKVADSLASPKPQYLILSTSGAGDPIGCNAPGTYSYPNLQIMHPTLASNDSRYAAWTPKQVTFGGFTGQAAGPWATLDSSICARTAFIHHATGTTVHSDESGVLSLLNKVVGVGNTVDQLTSVLSRKLAGPLGTVQVEPICLGASGADEAVIFGGRPQPMLLPRSLASVLIPPAEAPAAPLAQLQELRDRDLNAMVAFMRSHGTTGERRFLDAYTTSAEQVRSMEQDLLQQLVALIDNSANSQVSAAVILAQMNVSPVFTVHIPFGGDNHFDGGLSAEVDQTITGVRTINAMMNAIQKSGMTDRITFVSLNVFGRTMSLSNTNDNVGTNGSFKGRSHNSAHHTTIISGPNISGGVYGGLGVVGNDYGALPFNSVEGVCTESNDITMPTSSTNLGNSLASVGRTIGAAVGVSETDLDAIITQGITIDAAILR